MDHSNPSRCYKVALLGDVDRDGEVVDEARIERLRAAVGDDRAADVDRDSQVDLALELLRAVRA